MVEPFIRNFILCETFSSKGYKLFKLFEIVKINSLCTRVQVFWLTRVFHKVKRFSENIDISPI